MPRSCRAPAYSRSRISEQHLAGRSRQQAPKGWLPCASAPRATAKARRNIGLVALGHGGNFSSSRAARVSTLRSGRLAAAKGCTAPAACAYGCCRRRK